MVRSVPENGTTAFAERTDRLANNICPGQRPRFDDGPSSDQTVEQLPRSQSFRDFLSATSRASRGNSALLPERTLARCNSSHSHPRRVCSFSSRPDSESAGGGQTSVELRLTLRKARHVWPYWSD